MNGAVCDAFAALANRHSTRAFDPGRKVEPALVERLLDLAARAPSGSNIQPWRAEVVTGPARDRLAQAMEAAFLAGEGANEWPYYPEQWREPYLARRRELGKALYALVGVAKGDAAAAQRQMARNFVFFDAPALVIVTIDRDLAQGSWLDVGGFVMALLVAAEGAGLASCPMQAPAQFAPLIRAQLGVGEDRLVACAVALGYEAAGEPVNSLRATRVPAAEFARFHHD